MTVHPTSHHGRRSRRKLLGLAGGAFPSDVRAGLDLGRAVAEQVIERARADGSAAPWTGTVPDAPGQWNLSGYPSGTAPALPTAGTWQTWVLSSGSQFRPDPPPAVGSAQLGAETAEIKDFARTFQTNQASFYRLGTVGRDEYSVLSVLENAAHHDREHTLQMRSIMATG